MPYDVKLPDIGEGVAEGEIVRWLVKLGETVREDQPLVEVMTDKASVEIPSPRAGTISAINAEEGQVVPVGTVIVSIAVAGEVVAAPVSEPAPGAAGGGPSGLIEANLRPDGPPPAAPGAAQGRVQATPAVRALAKQLGIALEAIVGSGPAGAITADDVNRAGAGAAGGEASSRRFTSMRQEASPPAAPESADERIPLRGLRRKIAEAMRRSLDTAAHFTFVAECDFTALAEHRARLKPRADADGVKLTFLAYVAKAIAAPLREFPMLNASLDDERAEIVVHREIHLGIATATADGLTVPIVHHPDRMPLLALAREVQRLADAARAHKLTLAELHGGTFTLTSTGAKGGVLATPIIHHPQVAILGVHEVRKKPAVVGDQIVARDLGNLSLSLDHRVVDGAVGADFLYALIALLEHPASWLSEGDIA